MLSNEQALPIKGFKGLDKSSPLSIPGYTRSLKNVYVRQGKVTSRGGVDFDSTFSTALSENVTGMAVYVDPSTLAATLLRIGSTKVEKSTNLGAWSDITGTVLTGTSSDKPQWASYRDVLYFTNEGHDRPRWWAGSGNTTVISTAPWAKGILSFYGFLILLNVSDDGITFSARQGRYSEDPQNDWTLCEGNELNFNETTGAIMVGGQFGRTAVIVKEDGIVYLRWVGGPTRFSQELAKGAPGTIAPLSGQGLGEKGFIYLATDFQLWIATPNDVLPLPPNVSDILQNNLYKASVANCRSCVVPSQEQYNLFFPLDSSGNTGRVQYNFRTGEFSYSTYASHAFSAVETIKHTKTATESIIGHTTTKPFTLDSNSVKNDETSASASTSVSRYYDTDWQQYTNSNEGRQVQVASKFTGATLLFKKSSYAHVGISIAVDNRNEFRFRKIYKLQSQKPNDEFVAIRYDVPMMEGEWFNLRIEFFPSTTENPTLHAGWMHFLPEETKRDVNRSPATTEA